MPARGSLLRSSAAPLLLCGFAAALIAGVWNSTLSRIEEGRARLMVDAARDAASLARLVEEHSMRTIQSADQAAQFVRHEYREQGMRLDLGRLVRDGVVLSDIYNLYTIVGPDGKVLQSSQAFAQTDISDREHFKIHHDHPNMGLYISKPVLGRVSQRWSLQLTRRIETADGQFGGVVVVSMDPFYFTRLYESARIGRHSTVALIGDDGIVRARRSGTRSDIGLDVSQGSLFRHIDGRDSGVRVQRSVLDGRERIYAFRRIASYPLKVVVGIDTADVLDAYQPIRDKMVQQALLVTLAIAGFTVLLLVVVRRLVKSRAQALSASAAKTQFLSNMSHELRTPLNGILGYAELLREDLPAGEPREFAQIIHDSGVHLLALVNQILQLNKIEAGKEKLVLEPGDPRALLVQVVNAHRSTAQAKRLLLNCEVGQDVPGRIECDRIKLVQVLNNLVHNAIKFTDSGWVHVSLARAGGALRFEVSDSGPGIPHEVQALVFEKFFQVDAQSTRRSDGTGLGLSLVRQLVELMDGEVTLSSSPGTGTTFSFTIPCREVPLAPVKEAA